MIGLSWVMTVLGWLSYPYTYYFDHFGAFLHIMGCLRHDPVKRCAPLLKSTSTLAVCPRCGPKTWYQRKFSSSRVNLTSKIEHFSWSGYWTIYCCLPIIEISNNKKWWCRLSSYCIAICMDLFSKKEFQMQFISHIKKCLLYTYKIK